MGSTLWNCLQSVSNTLLIIIVASSASQPVYALSKEGPHVPARKLLVRQNSFSTSSSYDYWWPYPPIQTGTDTATDGTSTDMAISTSIATLIPTSSASQDMQAMSDILGQIPSLSSSSDTSSLTTATLDADISGSYSMSPFISITALPPLSSSPRNSHAINAYHKPLNSLLFLPLIGVFGALLGAVCGWWCFEYWRKRSPIVCMAGPRYGIVEGDESSPKITVHEKHIEHSTGKEVNECLLEVPGAKSNTPPSSHRREGATVLEGPIQQKDYFGWSRSKLASLLRSPAVAGSSNGIIGSKRTDVEHASGPHILDQQSAIMEETDIQIDPSQRHASFPYGKALSPNAPTVFSSVASSDEDEDYEDARKRSSGRQKSVRKRLVERLGLLSGPKIGTRQKSRDSKRRGRTPELEEGNLLGHDFVEIVDHETAFASCSSMRIRPQTSLGHGHGHGRAISDVTLPADFPRTPPKAEIPRRVYQLKDPGCGSATRPILNGARAYSTPLRETDSEAEDKFTPIPMRKNRSAERRHSNAVIENCEDEIAYSSTLGTERNTHPFPASPPQLNSPRLDQELFFDTKTYFASIGKLDTEIDSYSEVAKRRPSSSRQVSGRLYSKQLSTRDTVLASRNLPSQVRERELPPSPPHRHACRSSSSSPTKRRFEPDASTRNRERSNTLPESGLMSPKQRFEARRTALDRVDVIVEHAWNSRHFHGTLPPTSPTMFGAHLDNER